MNKDGETNKVLEIKQMSVTFLSFAKGLFPKKVSVLKSVDFHIRKGEIVGLCGESGAGKSIIASVLLGILPENTHIDGQVYYKGKEVKMKDFRYLRGKEIALVPQGVTALDPLMKIGDQLKIRNRMGKNIQQLLECYTLSEEILNQYPFQLSGGMAKKILLLTAVLSGAQVIIADEPTSGIDEEALEKILKHLKGLAEEGKSIILITHDIEAAFEICNRICIIKEGKIIEDTTLLEVKHPYTKALLKAMPKNEFSL